MATARRTSKKAIAVIRVKSHANWRNIVGQQLPTFLDVTCHGRMHTLLHVVGSCWAKFETSQTFEPATPNISSVPSSPKRSATTLDPFALPCELHQHCWGHARALRLIGCNPPTLHCRSQHCWELLHPFANHCQHGRHNSQHYWPNTFWFLDISSAARLRRPLS